jgi:biopolymer transport protein ExbD
MSMSVGPSSEAMCDINTTPLIDVMLVLLVTLIISLPIMTHAVKLDMPNPNQPPPPQDQQPEVINLEIDGDGTVVWDGNPLSGIPQLEGYFASETTKDPQPEIHLRPDRRAKYDVVAKVLAAAQRNHMKKIGFVNVAEFKD